MYDLKEKGIEYQDEADMFKGGDQTHTGYHITCHAMHNLT